jgi:hypothetical protein
MATVTTDTPVLTIEPGTDAAEAVFLALGAASVCWQDLTRAGRFDSERATRIGEELLAYLRTVGLP